MSEHKKWGEAPYGVGPYGGAAPQWQQPLPKPTLFQRIFVRILGFLGVR